MLPDGSGLAIYHPRWNAKSDVPGQTAQNGRDDPNRAHNLHHVFHRVVLITKGEMRVLTTLRSVVVDHSVPADGLPPRGCAIHSGLACLAAFSGSSSIAPAACRFMGSIARSQTSGSLADSVICDLTGTSVHKAGDCASSTPYEALSASDVFTVRGGRLGHPMRFDHAIGNAGTLVLLSELALPAGSLGALALRRRRARMFQSAQRVARDAWEAGVESVVALSSTFVGSEPFLRRSTGSILPPETAEAQAVEAVAKIFSDLGGRSVVLRAGWPYGSDDPLTRWVLDAAVKGWQVLDGPEDSPVPTVEIGDVASAIVAAFALPTGIYDVIDGALRTQEELSDAIASGMGHGLQPLGDARWGFGPLFGSTHHRGIALGSVAEWTPSYVDPLSRFFDLARFHEGRLHGS